MAYQWHCGCGFDNWNHHTNCYRCFGAKPEESKNGIKLTPETAKQSEADQKAPTGGYIY
jgi:hypothetical protein